MDFLEFFAVVEQDRDILNPISARKLERVAGYAGLRDGLSVLDLGSGKAAMLRQWAARWAIRGTGLELNPAFVREARALAQAEGMADRLHLWEGRVLDFTPEPDGYDVVSCLGAPFVIGSFAQAVAWMRERLKPGGSLVIGDTYLRKPAPPDDLERWGCAGQPTLEERCAELQAAGLTLTGLAVASTDDWDHYTGLMWSGVARWAGTTPHHPHRAEILEKVEEGRRQYLGGQREHLGWAVLVARAN
ncbi:SAM-dependent methyltransferase [Deinococcus frigens]|uniref:SAM-dependent methyltransferase n=1 Tax=Deinococcus frigens TaxID=249403 RepID=UPI000497D069|nr:methyltransferase domain-containing protein [Deinococcus frigens]